MPETLTQIETAECYYFPGGLADTFTIAGITTTPTAFCRVVSAEGARHSGKFDSSKFYVRSRVSHYGVANTNADYTEFAYLQVENNHSLSGSILWMSCVRSDSAATGVCCHHTIVRNTSSDKCRGLALIGPGNQVYRNEVIDCNEIAIWLRGANSEAKSNTIYTSNSIGSSKGIYTTGASGSNIVVRNNAVFGYSTYGGAFYEYNEGSWDDTNSGNNATDAADAGTEVPGSNNLFGLAAADQFKSLAGDYDLHLKSGSALIAAGADLGAPYDIDIDGETVPAAWDIGADQHPDSLAVDDSFHAHTTDGAILSVVRDALHTQTSETVGIIPEVNPANCVHVHTADLAPLPAVRTVADAMELIDAAGRARGSVLTATPEIVNVNDGHTPRFGFVTAEQEPVDIPDGLDYWRGLVPPLVSDRLDVSETSAAWRGPGFSLAEGLIIFYAVSGWHGPRPVITDDVGIIDGLRESRGPVVIARDTVAVLDRGIVFRGPVLRLDEAVNLADIPIVNIQQRGPVGHLRVWPVPWRAFPTQRTWPVIP